MLRAISVSESGKWPVSKAAGAVSLDYDGRYRRRVILDCTYLGKVLLDLPETVVLADGDGLKLADGRWIAVIAAEEDLLEITMSNSYQLLRIAWHLGNHHCPAELTAERIRIRQDHVIEAMLKGLGCHPVAIKAGFYPEKGAYHHAGKHQ